MVSEKANVWLLTGAMGHCCNPEAPQGLLSALCNCQTTCRSNMHPGEPEGHMGSYKIAQGALVPVTSSANGERY